MFEDSIMRPPQPLPDDLAGHPFTVRAAEAAGISRKRLQASDLVAPSRGLRVPANREIDLAEYAAAVLATTPDGWISHVSAAQLYGLWLPARLVTPGRLDVCRDTRRWEPRRRGVRGHTARITGAEIGELDGVRIVTRPRCWFDLLPMLRREEGVIIGDQLVRMPRPRIEDRAHPWAESADLEQILALNEWRPGVVLGREALGLIRRGSDSPMETRLRLAIIGAGLAEPELQLRLDPDDPYSPEADLGYRAYRIALDYEGSHHLSREQQSRDIARDETWTRARWRHLRCDVADSRTGFRRVIETLRGLIPPVADAAVGA